MYLHAEKNLYVRYFKSIFVLLKISDETTSYWSCNNVLKFENASKLPYTQVLLRWAGDG